MRGVAPLLCACSFSGYLASPTFEYRKRRNGGKRSGPCMSPSKPNGTYSGVFCSRVITPRAEPLCRCVITAYKGCRPTNGEAPGAAAVRGANETMVRTVHTVVSCLSGTRTSLYSYHTWYHTTGIRSIYWSVFALLLYGL